MAVVPKEVPAPREGSPSRHLPTDWLGWAASGVALAGFALVLVGWVSGGVAFSLPWAPTLACCGRRSRQDRVKFWCSCGESGLLTELIESPAVAACGGAQRRGGGRVGVGELGQAGHQ